MNKPEAFISGLRQNKMNLCINNKIKTNINDKRRSIKIKGQSSNLCDV